MIVCVAANPSVDKLFRVDRLEPGRIHRPAELTRVPGGKGLNAARAAHTVGGSVTAVALLGGHNGRWIAEALAAEGVTLRAAWQPGESRHSLSVYDADCGALTEFYEPGAPIDDECWRGVERLAAGALRRAAWIAVSGSLPPGAPADAYARLVQMARRHGVPVAVDADGDALAAAVAERPDVVKVNAAEAAGLLGDGGPDGRDGAVDAARRVRDRLGPGGAAAVTHGADGAALAAPDDSTWHARAPARGPYPVGSGDSFLGGLLVALSAGAAWPDALARATAAGVANAEEPGAGRLRPARAEELLPAVRVEPA